MASITRNHLYTVDLNKPLTRQSCGILLAEGDNKGDCFSFALVRDGVNAAVDSTAVVSGYMIRQDGSTVPVNGTYAGNNVSVTLPKACYAQEGHFALAVKVDMSGATTTVAVLDGFIKNVTTDTVVDPSTVIPTLEDLLAQIERMETATEAANTAAANAQEFIVTVTQPAYILDGDTSGITADKTFAEIQAAITAGKTPVVKLKTSGQVQTKVLHLTMIAPASIVFREHTGEPSTYNTAGSTRCTFISSGTITVDAAEFHTVPDNGTEGQVLVKTGDSTYGWRDSEQLSAFQASAPAIIPTATGDGIVAISDSAHRPLAGLRLYGKTTQDGTPTPDAPVPLVDVGAGGSIVVEACGANLLSRDDLIDGVQVASPDDAAAIVDGYGWRKEVPVGADTPILGSTNGLRCLRPGITYTLSFVAWCSGTGNTRVDCYPDTLPETGITLTGTPTRYTWTFSSDKAEMALAKIRVYGANTGSDTWVVRVVDIKLEVGSTATPFESYADGGSVTASTPNGLPGIPVSSGGNYTDENGQQWVCDEKDFGRGVYVHRITKYVLDGSQPVALHSESNEQWTRFDHGTVTGKGGGCILSDAFVQRGAAIINTVELHGSTGILIVRPAGVLTESEWTARLAANPVTVLVQAATSTETPLSAEEIAAYRAMSSQKPTTTVYNDAGAGMAVDYIADTKNYIDQRISALLNA